MGFSKLIDGKELANSSNYTQGRKGYKICKFTPHHMAGKLSAKRCCELFQNPNRNASANYCIGVNGELYGCVDENNRAWTSSSSWNDCQAITVEVANSSTGGQWPISEASWNTLVNLAEDVCRRYGFRLEYTGTKNGSLTCHEMYANTNCPGPYLKSRLNELAKIVNARLDKKENAAVSTKKSISTIAKEVMDGKWGTGSDRKKKLEAAGYNYSKIQEEVNKIMLKKPTTTVVKKSNDIIAKEVMDGKWGTGSDRKKKLEAAGYNYNEIQKIVNKKAKK